MDRIEDFDYLMEHLGKICCDLAALKNQLSEMQSDFKKVFPAPQSKKSNNFGDTGGIIGGEIRGDYKGRKEGGKKGGENPFLQPEKPKPKSALKDFTDDVKESVVKLNKLIEKHLTQQEMAYLSSREQFVLACKAYEKLKKLGYNDAMMGQAIFNAFNDQFWAEKLRHFKALANTSKNGVLVIENLLKINQSKHKLNYQKPVYKG
jgi:transcription termination factor NusB